MPTSAPVDMPMTMSHSFRITSAMFLSTSTSVVGRPSSRLAWMCTSEAPSPAARTTSSAISRG